MRRMQIVLAAILALSFLSPRLSAQENAKPDAKKAPTVLKVQATITESEGEKKLLNLPYTFFVRTSESGPGLPPPPWTKVRVGTRIPVATGSDKGTLQFQYIDVGTNIDARAYQGDDARFDLSLNLERSWVEGGETAPGQKADSGNTESNNGIFREPIIRQFKTELTLPMRDGQTLQTTQAADPLNGRVMTITVTVNVVK